MQKFINIDEKRNGHDQTNDKLREQKLNTRKSFLRLRLNFLNSAVSVFFRKKFSKHKIRYYQGFRQFSAEIQMKKKLVDFLSKELIK